MGFSCCDETPWPKASWGGKNLSCLQLQGRNLEVVTDAEAWRSAAYWLTPHSLLGLLCYIIQDHQSRDGYHPQWALLHQSQIGKMSHSFAYSQILWGYFLNWNSLLSDDSSLYQIDIKLASTNTKMKMPGSRHWTCPRTCFLYRFMILYCPVDGRE